MSQCQPVVSVVMAAKNYAAFLPQAVRSVQAQTFRDWELVIIDDGSTDATPQAVRPFLEDARIRYVRSDRLGQSRAKNLGVRFSRGEFLAFLDADDAWQPEKLTEQLAVFQDARIGVCFTARQLMDEAGTVRPANDPPAPSDDVRNALFLRNFICFSSVMMRRSIFEQVGGFDPTWDLSIDFDLWQRVTPLCHFQFLDKPLTLYRTGHGNLSKRLADRVSTALAIMDRAVTRHRYPPEILREGYASTYRGLAYVLRDGEPLAAAKLYAQALWIGGVWQLEVWKGLLRLLLVSSWQRKRLTGENASLNR